MTQTHYVAETFPKNRLDALLRPIVGILHGLLDTLSVPACFLQSQQRGILEIVEKMFERSLEVL